MPKQRNWQGPASMVPTSGDHQNPKEGPVKGGEQKAWNYGGLSEHPHSDPMEKVPGQAKAPRSGGK